jgi:hypothetical protein
MAVENHSDFFLLKDVKQTANIYILDIYLQLKWGGYISKMVSKIQHAHSV